MVAKNEICPCCGAIQPMAVPLATRIQQEIFECVRKQNGRIISAKQIMDYVYADRIDGGPESDNAIRVYICRMNKTLRKYGLRIKGIYGPVGGYRLIKEPEAK